MTDHYYTPTPQSEHKPAQFDTVYRGHTLTFETDSGVFSRTGLDKGSEILLGALPDEITGPLLDMGCGYGALGVSIGKANLGCQVTMADINTRAVALAKANAYRNGVAAETMQSDGFAAVMGRKFAWIVTNPPIRAGKKVIYAMFANAAKSLLPGGKLILVIRKQQGAPSAQTYLKTLFTQVDLLERSSGYWVLCCKQPLAIETEQKEER